ncbi:MAG: hypothetical protein KAH32_07095 [Chlamydiia bacterium]|nr:hypothetical protein [Chlamydiia bacterium]
MNNLYNCLNHLQAHLKVMVTEKPKNSLIKISIIVLLLAITLIFHYIPGITDKNYAYKHMVKIVNKNRFKHKLSPRKIDDHARKISKTIEDAMRTGTIFEIGHPGRMILIINLIKDFAKSTSGISMFNDRVSRYCGPRDMFIYECMIITEILMQKSELLQYDVTGDKCSKGFKDALISDKENALDDSLKQMSTIILEEIHYDPEEIKALTEEVKNKSYDALSDLKELYEYKHDAEIETEQKYQEEFLRNLNIVLYIISNEDLDNIDKGFIDKIKPHISTYFSDDRKLLLPAALHATRGDNALTKREAQEQFIQSFEDITNITNNDNL